MRRRCGKLHDRIHALHRLTPKVHDCGFADDAPTATKVPHRLVVPAGSPLLGVAMHHCIDVSVHKSLDGERVVR